MRGKDEDWLVFVTGRDVWTSIQSVIVPFMVLGEGR